MQEQSSSGGKTSYKLYVEVGVVYAPGGCGICYFVRVKGQDARLFYEDSPDACRWFVESKYPV